MGYGGFGGLSCGHESCRAAGLVAAGLAAAREHRRDAGCSPMSGGGLSPRGGLGPPPMGPGQPPALGAVRAWSDTDVEAVAELVSDALWAAARRMGKGGGGGGGGGGRRGVRVARLRGIVRRRHVTTGGRRYGHHGYIDDDDDDDDDDESASPSFDYGHGEEDDDPQSSSLAEEEDEDATHTHVPHVTPTAPLSAARLDSAWANVGGRSAGLGPSSAPRTPWGLERGASMLHPALLRDGATGPPTGQPTGPPTGTRRLHTRHTSSSAATGAGGERLPMRRAQLGGPPRPARSGTSRRMHLHSSLPKSATTSPVDQVIASRGNFAYRVVDDNH